MNQLSGAEPAIQSLKLRRPLRPPVSNRFGNHMAASVFEKNLSLAGSTNEPMIAPRAWCVKN
jgi:hypothetical protein